MVAITLLSESMLKYPVSFKIPIQIEVYPHIFDYLSSKVRTQNKAKTCTSKSQ